MGSFALPFENFLAAIGAWAAEEIGSDGLDIEAFRGTDRGAIGVVAVEIVTGRQEFQSFAAIRSTWLGEIGSLLRLRSLWQALQNSSPTKVRSEVCSV